MSNSQKKIRLGVIGKPISHSLSPTIHGLWINHFNLQASYEALLVDDLKSFFNCAKDTFSGFNVTVPYKEQVLKFCDDLSPEVRALGAANTIVNENGRWKAYNTDGLGFIRSVDEQLSLAVLDKDVLVFGAGGSAKAVVAALISKQVNKIYICNRTHKHALEIQNAYLKTFPNIYCIGFNEIQKSNLCLKNVALVVNTTSVGLNNSEECLIADASWLHSGMSVIDLVYKPAVTMLLKQASKKQLSYTNGLGMLVYQAAYAFTHFTGKPITSDLALAALKEIS